MQAAGVPHDRAATLAAAAMYPQQENTTISSPLLHTINAANAAGAHTTLLNRSNAQILVRQPPSNMARIMAPSVPFEQPTTQLSHEARAAAIAKAMDGASWRPPSQNTAAAAAASSFSPSMMAANVSSMPVSMPILSASMKQKIPGGGGGGDSNESHQPVTMSSTRLAVSSATSNAASPEPAVTYVSPLTSAPAAGAVSGYSIIEKPVAASATVAPPVYYDAPPLEAPLSTPADWHIPNVQMIVNNQRVTLHEALCNRRGIIFGVPGAFTPVCSQRHVPGFRDAMPILRQAVEYVACVAVNDQYVLGAWAKELNMPKDIVMISDWEGKFTEALGLELDASSYHMGMRCRRFCIFVSQGTIVWFGLENDAFVDQVALILHRLQLLNDEQLGAIQDLAHRLETAKSEPQTTRA